MHEQAELGVAAHWRYKETGGSQRSAAGNAALDRKIGWMRRLLEAGSEGAGELAGGLDTELVEDRIYVLTPRGEVVDLPRGARSEEHTSELQSLMRISYAVFCLKKKKNNQ